jgi:F-box interacting protein
MSSDKRRATVLEDLPEEILVDQILILLPSKDVGRCRAVSTSWRSATSTPAFMLEHHRRQPLLPILNGRGRPASYVVFRDAGAGASSQELWPFLPVFKNRSGNCIFASYDASVRCGGCIRPGAAVPILENQLLASCDGFLIIHHGPLLYICNPVIRTHALLPLPYCCGPGFTNTVIGFYQHHPTEDYRVLLVSKSRNHPKYSLHNLTVGSDELRHITVTMPAVSSPSVEQKLLMGLTSLYRCPPPVQHRASLHWFLYGANDITEGGGDIIVFDTEAESFHWMRSPTQLFYSRKLFNMKGTLAFGAISTDNTAINVWVMQDFEAETWAFRCRIDMSTVEASRELYITSLKKRRKKKTPLDS